MPIVTEEQARRHFDELLRHATHLIRTEHTIADDIGAGLRDGLFDAMEDLGRRLRSVPHIGRGGVSTLARAPVQRAVARAEADVSDAWKSLRAEMNPALDRVAKIEARYQVKLMSTVFEVEGNAPDAAQLRALKHARPFNGRFLKEWYGDLEAQTKRDVRAAVRQGIISGQPTDVVARQLREAVPDLSVHRAKTLARTSIHHVAVQAQSEAWAEFDDIIEEERWVATLDSRVCPTCGAYDGQVFPLGKGPTPPSDTHPNCRCIRSPHFVILSGKRAAQGGAVEASINVDEWLRTQPFEVQKDVLGRGLAEHFRTGKYRLEDFSDVAGRRLSLRAFEAKSAA